MKYLLTNTRVRKIKKAVEYEVERMKWKKGIRYRIDFTESYSTNSIYFRIWDENAGVKITLRFSDHLSYKYKHTFLLHPKLYSDQLSQYIRKRLNCLRFISGLGIYNHTKDIWPA